MDRSPEYFAEKYGDLPYVVVTPEDFKFVAESHLALVHAQNGDPIIAIEPCGEAQTYDVEMAPDGPLNFIANGIVSHNSHAAAYAQITYQTAYLKANYPAEYMAAFLSTAMGDGDKVVKGVVEVKRMGASGVPITILPPSLNNSQRDFSIEMVVTEEAPAIQGVRFGMAAVKNVGVGAIDAIIVARKDQPDGRFASLDALCSAVDSKVLNKRVVESLIKAGALDDLGSRGDLLDQVDGAMTAGQKAQEAKRRGQADLFGMFELAAPMPVSTKPRVREAVEEIPRKTILAWEKEVTGLYFSEHPLSLVEVGEGVTSLGDLSSEFEGKKVTVVAMVNNVRRVITKKSTTMGIIVLEDMSGSVEMVAFPDCFEKHSSYFVEDEIVKIVAKVELRHDAVQLVCETAESFVQVERGDPRKRLPTLHLTLTPNGEYWRDIEVLSELRNLLKPFDGDESVVLHIAGENGHRAFRVEAGVTYCSDLEKGLVGLLGPAAIRQEFPKPIEDIYEAMSAD